MRIGYCSPFNPMRSGISDFSEELVWKLKEYCEIIIFSPVKLENKDIANSFECHDLADLEKDDVRRRLDLIVYHVGNNYQYHGKIVEYLKKYPGIVELHDLGLHHLSAAMTLEQQGQEAYLELVKYCHGERGVAIAKRFFAGQSGAPWNDHALDMCMNRHVIEHAKGMIVHSEMAKQVVLGLFPEMPIINIMLHTEPTEESPEIMTKAAREKFGFNNKTLVMGSFGFATSAKRIIPCLDALKHFKESHDVDFSYLIVGEAAKDLNLKQEISSRGLEKNVIVTGFTTLEDFKQYMWACDLCFNLRYPTQGESSASLHRLLGMGKTIVVTDIGSFSDYPSNVALKVGYGNSEVDDIYQAICQFVEMNPAEKEEQRRQAQQFAQEYCDIEKNACLYREFFWRLIHGVWQPDYCDVMIGRLCELGLTDESYTARISELMNCLGLL